MHNAGALRIDHVMSLMRLYIIPDKEETGTYVYYNLPDMLGIVALESALHRCSIVGESIGNVPDGFLDHLDNKNIYSLSVLWAERKDSGWGDFNRPSEYPANAFVSVGTHDMAPLRMWWFGYDIEQAFQLGMIEDEQGRTDAYKKREADRWKLLSALDESGVWPEDNLRKGNYLYGEAYPEGMEEAVHRFVARTPCPVFWRSWKTSCMSKKCRICPAPTATNIRTGAASCLSIWSGWKAILLMSGIFVPLSLKDKTANKKGSLAPFFHIRKI